MFIKRKLTARLTKLKKQFPVLGILGPRQSGKTTLSKALFPEHQYVNLEELDLRRFAQEDPRRFIDSLGSKGAILDEIQRVPDLLSYIQSIVDHNPRPGFFVLTGSENILLNDQINQTLAGRIAITTLLPLSIEELEEASLLNENVDDLLFRGFYPSLYAKKMDTTEWLQSYIQTYIERDVRQIKQITDLSLFQKFLQLCAGRIGQLLDLTSIGNECGISAHTVRSWISILEATYVIFLLRPHFQNFNKRVVKTPKIYFYDSGIACRLLSIASSQELKTHYLRGGLFESMIISDLLKERHNLGNISSFYFWRDKSGLEIDCLIDHGTHLVPVEIKSGETIHTDFFLSLTKWNQLSDNKPENSYVIYGGKMDQTRSQGTVLGWQRLPKLLKNIEKSKESKG